MSYQTNVDYKMQSALTLYKGNEGVSDWYVHTEDSDTKNGSTLVIRKNNDGQGLNNSYKFRLEAVEGSDTYYRILHVATGGYVRPKNSSTEDGKPIQVYKDNDMEGESYQWAFTNQFTDSQGRVWFWFQNRHSSKEMKIKDNDNENGTPVQQVNAANGADTKKGDDINMGFYFRLEKW